MRRIALAAACVVALTAQRQTMAVAQFSAHVRLLLPGSRLPLRLSDGTTPTRTIAIGVGEIDGTSYVVPGDAAPGRVTLVATRDGAIAERSLRIVAPPRGTVIAVAAYDGGIAFADPRRFTALGTLATGGAPSDIASLGGTILATDTDGSTLTSVTMAPWNVQSSFDAPLGDEIAVDRALHAFFVTEREYGGKGGVARVSARGVTSVVTGTTAEGVAIDERRERVYVADVNDDAVAIVDARTMRVIGNIRGVPRAFSLALAGNGTRLYVVSNESASSLFARAGSVTEFDVSRAPRRLARSEPLTFPLGIAFDAPSDLLFVTDEEADVVDVLDGRTLRPRHAPLRTCRTPWKPAFDAQTGRLFVPCARSDEVDVFDARTFGRVHGAPFSTAGYPLAVTVVRP